MNEAPTLNKFEKWKRPILGGVISSFLAGISVGLGVLPDHSSELLQISAIGFTWFFIVVFAEHPVTFFVIAIIVWFLVGVVITCLARKNIVAICIWLTLYISSMGAFLLLLYYGVIG